MRRLAALLVASVALFAAAPALAGTAAPSGPVSYRPPVDAPVVDPFRPPAVRWGSGNRGLEYAPARGSPVLAAADGEVVFAGPVAGGLHVVVLHADGVRTSYSFLDSVGVHRGDRVRQGQPVGLSGDRLHFGARVGDEYIDPAQLFAGGIQVHLVPDEERSPRSESEERGGLLRMLRRLPQRALDAGAAAAAWVGETAKGSLEQTRSDVAAVARATASATRAALTAQAPDLGRLLDAADRAVDPSERALAVARRAERWWNEHHPCTPADQPAPPLRERHLVVLVAGLGSSSTNASVDSVDTTALGYAPSDVVRFSYLGGTVEENPYRPPDTTVDIRQSGRRLRELLQRLGAEHPGVPIDIIAHSQGGLVSRSALAREVDEGDPRLPPLGALVTLATPHRGADAATALSMMRHTYSGNLAQGAVHAALPGYVDPRAPSVRQLATTSKFLRRLNRRPLPQGLKVTSIAARGDLVVPAGRAHLPGAHNVAVSIDGLLTAHSGLPGSAPAQREVALALAGRPPTCQGLLETVADAVLSDQVGMLEELLGFGGWAAGQSIDNAALPVRLPR